MKAVYIEEYGSVDVLKIGERDIPKIKEDEVLIKVRCAAINPRDWLLRSGKYFFKLLMPKLPFILGSDASGEIVDIGNKVEKFAIGDRVMGMQSLRRGMGAYAEYMAIPANSLAKIPSNISFQQAAGFPLVALTVKQALNNIIHSHQKILIIGASGGVGSIATQYAKANELHVTGVCSKKNVDFVQKLGAHNVFDYSSADITSLPEKFDVIFDTIGIHDFNHYKSLLTNRGCYITTIPSFGNLIKCGISHLSPGKKCNIVMVKSNGKDLKKMAEYVSLGQLTPIVDKEFSLQDVKEAHQYSRSFRARGKIILNIHPLSHA